jgi:hypothetical protein
MPVKQNSRSLARPVFVAIGAIGVTVLLGVIGVAEESTQPPGRPAAPPMHFKNLKVLKKLPPEQLIPVMRKINASLGVRCDFCHVINADHTGFERDDKPEKNMARKMIVLTQNLYTHQKILDGKASCYMCHHGHAMPEVEAPPLGPPPGGPPPGGPPPSGSAR